MTTKSAYYAQMLARLAGALLFVAAGCTPGVRVSSGAGGSTATTSGSAVQTTTASATTGTTGTGTCSPADCADMNPCTDDTCIAGMCQHKPKAAGTVGNTSEGACNGVCEGDGSCGLQLYERPFPDSANMGWAAPRPLSTVWTGQNAPPPHGILATMHSHADDRLFVFATDGNVYELKGNAWLPPVAIPARFPGLPGTKVQASYIYQPTAGGAESVQIGTTGTTPRHAYLYTLASDDTVSADSMNPYSIKHPTDSNAPSQDTLDNDWGFTMQTAYTGQAADWVLFYMHYAPASVPTLYKWSGGTFIWEASWPDAQSPLWMGPGAAPKPGSVVASYYANGIAYLVAP